MISLLLFIAILSLLVLIHEFGHFIAAKRNGVLVEEFGLGFPPRLFGIKKGETLYSINLLPLGGFVKVYGEEFHETSDGDPKLKNRAFVNKKPLQRSIILIAGVLMNMLLGIAIYYVLLVSGGFKSEPIPIIGNYHFRFGTVEDRVVVADATANSPAQKAGAATGDQIIRVRKETDPEWQTISNTDELIHVINSESNAPVQIELINVTNDVHKTITVTPIYNKELKRNIIGVSLAQAAIIRYDTPIQKVFSGPMHSYNLMAYNLNAIGTLFASSFKEKSVQPVAGAVSGPIGIFGIIQDTLNSSGKKLIVNLANIIALLSLSLATMNLLPFPALDGGRLTFVIYEWITKKRPSYNFERYTNLAGFIVLISLMILVSASDLIKLFR